MRYGRRASADRVILFLVIALILFGFIALSSASSDIGKSRFNDPYYYLFHQIAYGATLGVIGFWFGLYFPYDKYRKLASLIFFSAIGLLVLTLTPFGFSAGGATRWISLGPITLQPAELMKIAVIIYLSAWLSNSAGRQKDLARGFIPFLFICSLTGAFLLLQRSTSSLIIVLFSSAIVYFVSGARMKYLFYAGGLALAGIALIIFLTPYRAQRVATFLHPQADQAGAGYQINQALTTIGSGGVFGKGYGKSVSKAYLPEQIGDSIFAIIGEEFGFLGATLLILAYLIIVIKSYFIASKIRDTFGKLMLVGFASLIGLQVFMNIGAISGLIPLTGVPLPFISYGGTALAAFMTAAGIMLNISRRA